MRYHIKDVNYPNRSYFFNGKMIEFDNYEATVDADVAYRMSRISNYYKKEYDILTKKKIKFNPDTWKKEKRLIWNCNVSSANGFGHVSEEVILSLLRLGINVQSPNSISGAIELGGEFVDKNIEESLNRLVEPDCFEIYYAQPPAIKTDIVEKIIPYVMYETSITPKSWIKKLNNFFHVLVPSQWLVDSWQEQGLKTPMSVLGHGIDPKIYHYLDRPERETYKFLQFGQLGARKGTDLAWRAFSEEFTEKDNVELILKGNTPILNGVLLDAPQVRWIHAIYSKQQMQDLLYEADCYVGVSRGEGFNACGLEAMATGMPIIANNWSGMRDYLDPNDSFILDYSLVRSWEFDLIYKPFYKKGENSGYWAETNLEQLKKIMRWCYENRSKAKEMGQKASERIARDWTWDRKISTQLLPLLSELSNG